MSVEEAHEVSHNLEEVFKKVFRTSGVELLAHMEPCEPTCCVICRKNNCTVRKQPLSKDILWDAHKISTTSEYSLIK
jgi:hypothetical protein